MFIVFIFEMYVKETDGASIKKNGLNEYLGYMYNAKTSLAFVDEIMKQRIEQKAD